MPDEKYSVVVDYVAKNGKLPIATLPPQVIVSQGKSGSGGGLKETILTAVVSSVMNGILGAFMKTKAPMKFPKASRTPSKANDIVRENIKVTNKNKELKAQIKKTQVNLKNTKERLASKRDTLEKKKEQLRESEVIKNMERQENIANRDLVNKLQRDNDYDAAVNQLKKSNNLNDIIKETELKVPKLKELTLEEKFSQVKPQKSQLITPSESQTRYSKLSELMEIQKTVRPSDLIKPTNIVRPQRELSGTQKVRKTQYQEKPYDPKSYDNREGNRRVYKQDSLNEVTQ